MSSVFGPIRSAGLFGIIVAGISFAPAFAQGTLTPEQMSLRVQDLSESSQRSEAALEKIQLHIKDLSDEVARQGRLIDNRAMLDMIQLVDQLSDEVSQLTGAIEQQRFDIDGIKKRQRELYVDIDRRLRDLESTASAQAPAGSISIPKVETTTPAASSQQSSTTAQATTPEPAASGSTTTTASITQTRPATAVEKAAYQAAFDTLKEGRYKNAKVELRRFVEQFPDSSFAGNAQYWLGEAHYVTRNFKQGIVEFEKVLSVYPTSNKVPDAMLKLGYTYYELKQFEQAKLTLQELRKRYAKSTASRLAAKRLDRIRKEGH